MPALCRMQLSPPLVVPVTGPSKERVVVQRVPNLWGWQPCDKPGLLWINIVVFNHDGAIGLESRSLAWRRPGGKIPK